MAFVVKFRTFFFFIFLPLGVHMAREARRAIGTTDGPHTNGELCVMEPRVPIDAGIRIGRCDRSHLGTAAQLQPEQREPRARRNLIVIVVIVEHDLSMAIISLSSHLFTYTHTQNISANIFYIQQQQHQPLRYANVCVCASFRHRNGQNHWNANRIFSNLSEILKLCATYN